MCYFLLVNFAIGLVAIPTYIGTAKRRNIIDVPNDRSSHTSPTPRGGGIFIAAGSLPTLAYSAFERTEGTQLVWGLIIGAALVAAVGFTDDLKSLPSILRLGGHFLAAVCLVVGIFFFDDVHAIPALAFPLLIGALAGLALWIVGCLNIYNFMDGVDGIATGQGIAASATWLVISFSLDTTVAGVLAASILGGLAAFLFFNWSPAKVFMGDGASGFLGFSFAALPLLTAAPTPADLWLKINLGALILFPFLFDGSFTLFRRAYFILAQPGPIRNQQSAIHNLARLRELTEAHRSHLYQRWVQAGASHQKVALAYTGWAVISGGAALLVHFQQLHLLVAWSIALLPAAVLLLHSRNFPGC